MSDAERPTCPLWAKIIATGGGVGYIPFAPGTWGSLTAIVILFLSAPLYRSFLYWNEHRLHPPIANQPNFICILPGSLGPVPLILAVLFIVIGVPAAGIYAKALNVKDPSRVVMDEFAGQMVTMLGFTGVNPGVFGILLAFILFRVLDIWKPWPIRRFEKLPGGWGIMMDDVVAGVFGAIILAVLVHFRWLPGM